MIDQTLLNILVCPETKSPVRLAGRESVDKVNNAISEGRLVNRGGQKVSEKIEGGLVRESSPKVLYPVRNDIPVMLIDEGILLDNL